METFISYCPRFSLNYSQIRPLDNSDPASRPMRYKKTFKFKAVWLRSKDCHSLIREVWDPGEEFAANLGNCTKGLMDWSQRHYPNIRTEIRRLNLALEKLQHLPYTEEVKSEERKLKVDWKKC